MIGPGGLTGVPKYKSPLAGVGTVTVDPGAILQFVVVHASVANATLSIFGGDPIPIPNGANPTTFQYYHTLYQANSANAGAIIGVNTDLLMVHWVIPGGARG